MLIEDGQISKQPDSQGIGCQQQFGLTSLFIYFVGQGFEKGLDEIFCFGLILIWYNKLFIGNFILLNQLLFSKKIITSHIVTV